MRRQLAFGMASVVVAFSFATTSARAETVYALAERCSPGAAPRVVAAIAAIESGYHPYAVHDNSTGQAHFFPSLTSAAAFVRMRLAQGADISGVGLLQINSSNFPGLGISVEAALDSCTNVHYGMILLHDYYLQAKARYGPTTEALRWALMAYNGGPRVFSSHNASLLAQVADYAESVWSTAVALPVPRSVSIAPVAALNRGRRPSAKPTPIPVEPSMSFQAIHADARVHVPVTVSGSVIQEQM